MATSKYFTVKSLPLKEVIADLAEKMQVKVQADDEEYFLNLPKNIGEGNIRGINFKSGLGIILYDCAFAENTEIRFTLKQVHPAKLLYLTGGKLLHWFEDSADTKHELDKYESAMLASKNNNGHVLSFKANTRTQICSLEINRKTFQSYLTHKDTEHLHEGAHEMLNDVLANKQFYYQGNYSLTTAESLNAINNCNYQGIMRKLFLEGVSYQLLTSLMAQYQDDSLEKDSQELIRRSDMQKIIKLAEQIEKDPECYASVKELANIMGTNENLLQTGFKHLTGYTVNQFIKSARLEKARELLIGSDLTVSEIVYKIGLTNRGYFARLFKERFKATPRAYRSRFNNGQQLPQKEQKAD